MSDVPALARSASAPAGFAEDGGHQDEAKEYHWGLSLVDDAQLEELLARAIDCAAS